MNALQESILKVVAYFDIFQYPLTAKEIISFMDTRCSEEDLQFVLNGFLRDEVIFKTHSFYTLHRNSYLGIKRIKENTAAQKQLRKAKKIGAFLTWFPFIKGVAISGSLSKEVAKEDSDIDFFIITEANRLWLSKLFFTLFIKCMSFISLEKWFCLNYVIDETNLKCGKKTFLLQQKLLR